MIALLALLLAAEPALNDVVRIAGKAGIGHACPIEGGLLLTNAHMTENMYAMRWSDGEGDEGTAEVLTVFDDADLASLRVTKGKVAHEFRLASAPPVAGERVFIRGYRNDGRKNTLGERRVYTRITRLLAGHVVYEDTAFGGSSGSCVFNERGEVVAINAAGFGTDTSGVMVGWGVGVWGEWARAIVAAK